MLLRGHRQHLHLLPPGYHTRLLKRLSLISSATPPVSMLAPGTSLPPPHLYHIPITQTYSWGSRGVGRAHSVKCTSLFCSLWSRNSRYLSLVMSWIFPRTAQPPHLTPVFHINQRPGTWDLSIGHPQVHAKSLMMLWTLLTCSPISRLQRTQRIPPPDYPLHRTVPTPGRSQT